MKALFKAALLCLASASLVLMHAEEPKTPAPTPPAVRQIQVQAEAARKQNHVDAAIALYKKGVGIAPTWDEGWWSLGTLQYSLGHFEEARDAFLHLVATQPNVGAPWAILGLSEFETKRYDQALSHLRHAAELHSGQNQSIADEANFHLALLLTRNEEYESAMKILGLFAQRSLNDAKYIEAMGIAALRKPLLPAEVVPTDRQLVMDVGRVMYDATALRTTEAGAEFKILVDKYPETPNIHYLYGSFLMFADANNGLREMKKELEISPAHVPAMVTIANEYIQRKEFQSALPYAKKATELQPQSFPAHAVLGRVLAEGDLDIPRGVQELEEARKLAPGSPQVRIALATAYAKAGRKEDAARERREFLRLRQEVDSTESPNSK
ncbi:MAG TPA: tetratricopeptide repeat protein [Bryobacteraceae bacterium]|nr:tetratricopeptide repeat protein [Bryobacteraceae bacterium]